MRTAWVAASGLVYIAACGSSAPPPRTPPPTRVVRAGVAPPADEVGFRKLLSAEVVNGGLWFAEPSCQQQFGRAGAVPPDAFDAFAHCVALLHLRPTGRKDGLDDTSVLTDDAGFEIEAHVVDGRLDFIGFSARAPGAPDLPTITPETLESLREAGSRNDTIRADEARAMMLPGHENETLVQRLRLCVGDDGRLTSVKPATMTSARSAAAFSAVARTWKFRPFVVANKPTAVCAILGLQYPAAPRDPDLDLLPPPPQLSKAGHPFYFVQPMELESMRVAGTKLVMPDDRDKIGLNGSTLVGSFKLCVDESGHYEQGTLLKSTGVEGYDGRIAQAMMQWAFKPYVVDGVAVPVCSAFTFIYRQR